MDEKQTIQLGMCQACAMQLIWQVFSSWHQCIVHKSIINPPQKKKQDRDFFCGGAFRKILSVPTQERHRAWRTWPRQFFPLARYFQDFSCARYLGPGTRPQRVRVSRRRRSGRCVVRFLSFCMRWQICSVALGPRVGGEASTCGTPHRQPRRPI